MKKPTEPPQKKSKATPQIKPGGDDDPSSDYTYEYDEESEESEGCERDNDPPVSREEGAGGEGEKRHGAAAQVVAVMMEMEEERRMSSDLASTARTSEIREILRNQAERRQGDRARPNLGQVKIEVFRGNREQYKDWKHIVQARRCQ